MGDKEETPNPRGGENSLQERQRGYSKPENKRENKREGRFVKKEFNGDHNKK